MSLRRLSKWREAGKAFLRDVQFDQRDMVGIGIILALMTVSLVLDSRIRTLLEWLPVHVGCYFIARWMWLSSVPEFVWEKKRNYVLFFYGLLIVLTLLLLAGAIIVGKPF